MLNLFEIMEQEITYLDASLCADVPNFDASIFGNGVKSLARILYNNGTNGRMMTTKNHARFRRHERVPHPNRAIRTTGQQQLTLLRIDEIIL